jgi:hypothetical protein
MLCTMHWFVECHRPFFGTYFNNFEPAHIKFCRTAAVFKHQNHSYTTCTALSGLHFLSENTLILSQRANVSDFNLIFY